MKRQVFVSLLTCLLVLWLPAGPPGTGLAHTSPTQSEIPPVTFALDFAAGDLQFSSSTVADVIYDRVTYPDTEPGDEAGKPELPFRRVQLLIPPDATVTGLTVTERITQEVTGTYNIVPAQPPAPCCQPPSPQPPGWGPTRPVAAPDPAVYASHEPYPAAPVRLLREGYLAGWHLVSVAVYPLQYVPAQRRLLLNTHIGFRIDLAPSPASCDLGPATWDLQPATCGPLPHPLTEDSWARYRALLAAITDNSEDIERYAPLGPIGVRKHEPLSLDEPLISAPPGPTDLPVPYLIVTDESLADAFQFLAQWKTQKGLPARIATTQWIAANYPGVDLAERIRNFLREAYVFWGTTWVLLGGDVETADFVPLVPTREGWTGTGASVPIPTDLYYADLDGNWNADGDAYFGELEDGVDLYPDLFVGRAPVRTPQEATTFVSKVLAYERSATPAELRYPRGLFMAANLFGPDDHEAQQQKDQLGATVFPPGFPIWKLYAEHGETGGNEELNQFNATLRLNEGYELVNHIDHSGPYVMGTGVYHTGGGRLSKEDMDGLTNHGRLSILWTYGCSPNAFDLDAISEHFIRNPGGGGVAFVGNSREGFTSQFYQDLRFWQTTFGGAPEVGLALASTQGPWGATYSFLMNLLGDPELAAHTQPATPLIVTTDPEWLEFTGPQRVTVRVQASHPWLPVILPVAGARVTFWKENETYSTGLTDADGVVTLAVAPRTTGDLGLTVTAADHPPSMGSLAVGRPIQWWLHYADHRVGDAAGNGNGRLEAGETITLPVALVNDGVNTATEVTATLSVELDAPVSLLLLIDGELADPQRVFIGATGRHPSQVPFLVTADEAAGRPAYTPGVDLGYFLWTDAGGWHLHWAGDGGTHDFGGWLISLGKLRDVQGYSLEPGDTFTLLGPSVVRFSTDVQGADEDGLDFASRWPGSNLVQVITATAAFGDIPGGGTRWSQSPFALRVDPAFPAGQRIHATLTIHHGPLPGRWVSRFELPVARPELVHWPPNGIHDANGNGRLEPGERAELSLAWRNIGDGDADHVTARLTSLTPWVIMVQDMVAVGNVRAGTAAVPLGRFVIRVRADWPGQPDLTFALEARDRYDHTWRHDPFELTSPPAAPTGADTLPERTAMLLAWQPNSEPDLAGYWVYRDEPAGPRLLNPDFLARSSRWLDTGLGRDLGYRYFVRAVDNSGNLSPRSAPLADRTNPADHSGWPQLTAGSIWGSPALADLGKGGPDPVPDPVVPGLSLVIGSLDGKVYAWDHTGRLLPGWPQEIGNVWASPAVGDVNEDGRPDVVAAARVAGEHLEPQVYAWNSAGMSLPGWPVHTLAPLVATPVIARLNPFPEVLGKNVIAAAEDGRVWVWDHRGRALPGWPIATGHWIVASSAVGDLDGDSDLEIVVGTWEGLDPYSHRGWVFAWHHDGQPVSGWPVSLPVPPWSGVFASPVLADLDFDRRPEVIVAGYWGQVHVFTPRGTPFPGWPQSVYAAITAQPTVGELDRYRGLEIVVGTEDGHVYAWHADGTPVAGWPVQITGRLRGVGSAPVIGDLDGDSRMEVVAGANDHRVHAWHADGTRVAGFPIRTGYNVTSGPALGDMDGDGDLELAVGSYDYAVYVFDLSGLAQPGTLEWPMFRYDPGRTGRYVTRRPWVQWLPLMVRNR